MISLASKFENLVNILGILPESTRVLILVFHVDLDVQFLMLFFVLFYFDIFCLRKFAHFEEVTLAVFEAFLLNEFLEESLGYIVVNHGVSSHLELVEVFRICYYISLHTLVVNEMDLYLVI